MTSTQIDQRVSLAVSTVIFALRPIRAPGPKPCGSRWCDASVSRTRVSGPCPVARWRWTRISPAPPAAHWNAPPGSRPTTSSSCTPSARSTALRPTASCRSCTGHSSALTRLLARWTATTSNGSWPTRCPQLAFDHNRIVEYALGRLRAKITYSPIAYAFLNPEFTLAELREVHEAVLRKPLDPANFRRQVLASNTIEPTGTCLTGTSHRPPALYRAVPTEERS